MAQQVHQASLATLEPMAQQVHQASLATLEQLVVQDHQQLLTQPLVLPQQLNILSA